MQPKNNQEEDSSPAEDRGKDCPPWHAHIYSPGALEQRACQVESLITNEGARVTVPSHFVGVSPKSAFFEYRSCSRRHRGLGTLALC
jgi:hypothetical protein